MRDVIKATLDICIEDIFVLVTRGCKDGLDGIMRKATLLARRAR